DDNRELNLVVELFGHRVMDDLRARRDDGLRRLREVHGMRRRFRAALRRVLLVVAAETEDVARGPRDRRLEPRLVGGDAEPALGERRDAVALEQRLAVRQRLARLGEDLRAARDQVVHRLRKPAAALTYRIPLTPEVRGEAGA